MNVNPVNFGKQYISRTSVRDTKTHQKKDVNFVCYDSYEDYPSLNSALKEWQKSRKTVYYADLIVRGVKKMGNCKPKNKEFYGIEDLNGDVQALCMLEKKQITHMVNRPNKIKEEICYFETNPKNRHGARKRQTSGLGAAMFREIIKLAQQNKIEYITLVDVSDGFWKKIPYYVESEKPNEDLIFNSGDYQKCIDHIDKMI